MAAIDSLSLPALLDQIKVSFSREGGAVGDRYFVQVLQSEKIIGLEYQTKFWWHRVLTEAFFDLFTETLTAIMSRAFRQGWPDDRENYAYALITFVTLFRTMRAADVMAVNGYRLDGYAHLRGVMDQILSIAGVANGLTTFLGTLGVADYPKDRQWTEAEFEKTVPNKMKVEKALLDKLMGSDSGLSKPCVAALRHWDRMFNRQVHGGLWTLFSEMKHWVGRRDASASLLPRANDDGDAMFVNQSDRLHWMAHRLLPTLQVEGREFNSDWGERWRILDATFRKVGEGLPEASKPLANAIAELVDTKFRFGPHTLYVER